MMLAKESKGIKKNGEWKRPLTDLQVITLDVAYADISIISLFVPCSYTPINECESREHGQSR